MALQKQITSVLEKTPQPSDKFATRVLIGAMKSMQCGRRWDGTGSNKYVDFGKDKINCFNSSTCLNNKNIGGDWLGRDIGFKSNNC